MKKMILAFSFLWFVSCAHLAGKPESADTFVPGPGWELTWSDEFNGKELDVTKWSYDIGGHGWGNSELQSYTSNSENICLTNGRLVIRAQRSNDKFNPFTSARINTKNKFSFQYGKLSARIKLPYGRGMWPALWMMGTNYTDAGWPMCGEFDIMELNGGGQYGDSVIFSTAHWYSEQMNDHVSFGLTEILTNPNIREMTPVPFAEDFHVFTMEWSPKEILTYFDEVMIFKMKLDTNREPDMTVFQKHFFLILDLAVGGTMSGIYSGKEIPGTFPRSMEVDWIRVYKQMPVTDGTNCRFVKVIPRNVENVPE